MNDTVYSYYKNVEYQLRRRADMLFSTMEITDKLDRNAANAIMELLDRWPNWINVKDRLPEGGQRVLAWVHTHQYDVQTFEVVRYRGNGKWEELECGYDPIAWMRLPDPPEIVSERATAAMK